MKIGLYLFLIAASGMFSSPVFAKTCSSDFSCGVGYKCIKDLYKSTGICAKTVNHYGTPTYNMPSTDSVGPKMDDSDMCSFSTECSIGFKCIKKSGQIKGYCMK